MVNEVIDFFKREKKSCLVQKVDYEKAYNNIIWNYLRFCFNKIGLGNKWKNWMEACVFNNSMLVLVNRSATKYFKVEKD